MEFSDAHHFITVILNGRRSLLRSRLGVERGPDREAARILAHKALEFSGNLRGKFLKSVRQIVHNTSRIVGLRVR